MKTSQSPFALPSQNSGSLARSRRRLWQRKRRRGSTLVETALCLAFVLLPLALGGMQFGLVLTTTHALQEVSREAGRFAAVHYGEGTFDGADTQGDGANQDSSLKNYLRDVAKANKIPWDDIKNSIAVSPGTGARFSGQPITVSITYPMRKRSIIGQLGFWKETTPGDAADGRINNSVKPDTPLSLSVLSKDYTVSSTFLMQ